MRRTGRILFRAVLICFLITLFFGGEGEARKRDVILSVNAEKRKVRVGEEFSIVYSMSVEDQSKFRLHMAPTFPDFTVVKELSRSKNSFIGGAAYTTFTYSYTLKANKSGELKTSRASFIYAKVTYTTAPVEIKVIKEKPLPVFKRQPEADSWGSPLATVSKGRKKKPARQPKPKKQVAKKPAAKPKQVPKRPVTKKKPEWEPGPLQVASEALIKGDHQWMGLKSGDREPVQHKKPASVPKKTAKVAKQPKKELKKKEIKGGELKTAQKIAKKPEKQPEWKPESLKVGSEALIKQKNRFKVAEKDQLYTYKEKQVAKQPKPTAAKKTEPVPKKTAKVAKKPLKPKLKRKPGRKPPRYPKKRGKLFVHAIVDRYEPFLGEGLVYTFKLFHKPDYYGSPAFTPPAFTGFFVEELPMTRTTENNRTLGGKYIVEEVNYALYPLVSGKVTIPASTLEFRDYDGGNKTSRTNTVEIEVMKLPEYDRSLRVPFSGSVGRFKIDQVVEVAEAVKGEPFELTVTIRGRGNVLSIAEPYFPGTKNFARTLIDTSENVITEFDGISGGKTFTYSVTARRAGALSIGGISYVYFDPDEMRYITTTTGKHTVKVIRGTETEVDQMERVADLITLLAPIRIGEKVSKWSPFYKSSTFLYLMLALLFSSIIVLSFSFKRFYESKNKDMIIRKKAVKEALTGIEYARSHLVNQKMEDFYSELHSLLNRFYIDHFGVDLITHPIDSIADKISGNGQGNGKELVTTLTDKVKLLNYYRYASKAEVTEMELSEFLTGLKENIKEFKRGDA
jgi:hypothetical protein